MPTILLCNGSRSTILYDFKRAIFHARPCNKALYDGCIEDYDSLKGNGEVIQIRNHNRDDSSHLGGGFHTDVALTTNEDHHPVFISPKDSHFTEVNLLGNSFYISPWYD